MRPDPSPFTPDSFVGAVSDHRQPRQSPDTHARARNGARGGPGAGAATQGRFSAAGAFAAVRRSRAAWWFTVAAVTGLVLGAGVALSAKMFALETFYVPSASMEGTLRVDDRILVEKLSYTKGTPKPGQVIVFAAGPGWEPGSKEFFVKRVIAVGGDRVVCCDAKGRIQVNGSPVYEPYIKDGARTRPFPPVRVPAGMVFVLGDNRENSADSRFRGPVDEDLVVGRVLFRVWPLTRLGVVTDDR